MSYPKRLPVDESRTPMQDYPPAVLAKATYASENSAASSVISVTHDTTILEVSAVGGPAVMKWIATSNTGASVISAAGTANFDHTIPTGMFRKFVIPKESSNVPANSIVGVNRREGLYQRVAIKAVGVSSILVTEY
ncbi:MAG: hypothetical protein KW793_04950 [Candidatus Doudnabacteria bacterium]|nr:hypothetical protein [Candidatus Doudnabacteria bacterium]